MKLSDTTTVDELHEHKRKRDCPASAGSMTAREFLKTALGGNMNFGTLKPLAIEEIMEDYAEHKIKHSKIEQG